MTTAYNSLVARERNAICQSYGRYPLAVSRAVGSRLYDLDGREYVDLLAGIAVANLGHSNPEITEAVSYTHLTLPTIYSV